MKHMRKEKEGNERVEHISLKSLPSHLICKHCGKIYTKHKYFFLHFMKHLYKNSLFVYEIQWIEVKEIPNKII